MSEDDARTQSVAELHERRKQVIRLHKKQYGVMQIVELIKDATKKVFLILDNLCALHSKPVKDWLAERTDCIEVFYLRSYAPELNPDERLNADMKHAIGAKVPLRTKPKLKAAAEDHITLIGKSPDRVCAYFKDPRVKYAA